MRIGNAGKLPSLQIRNSSVLGFSDRSPKRNEPEPELAPQPLSLLECYFLLV